MNGLLGASLRHSYSPRLHALLGDATYRLFEVAPEGLAAFLAAGGFHGLNVTIPYKKAVLPYCAALSPTARRLGAVNTLVRRENGTLYGDNTDFDGFLWLLRRNFTPQAGELALILGSGGAGVTVRAALESVGMRTVTVSRQGENNYVNLYRHSDAVLLVNATPVGMYPNNGGCLTDLSRLPSLRCVLDLVYNPEKTALLLEAERLGLAGEDGLPMLVEQARRSAELFRGGTIPPTLSDSILCKLRSEMRNIILIGMPGCGKTTVGRTLAEALGRPFFDADEMLERRVGCSCAELLLRAGEEAFRREETAVLAELGKRSGCVIATGGGCVTQEKNYPLLHQNGLLVRLLREPSRLPVGGRPISRAVPPTTLSARREPLYRRFADITIDNNGTVAQTVAAISEAL